MSNNFDTAILLDSGVGAIAAPGDYVGFGRAAGGVVSTGPRIYAGTGDPNGTVVAPQGSLWLQTDAAGVTHQNTDGATTWTQLGNLSGAVTITAVDTSAVNAPWTMRAGSATALTFVENGLATYLTFDTTANTMEIGAPGGLVLNDAIPLGFGTPGTDVVLTPDGTNVVVTGTGFLHFSDSIPIMMGTLGLGAVPDARIGYNLVAGALTINSRTITAAGGAGGATADFSFMTDSFTVNDAALGSDSGGVTLSSGSTDSTDGGGTGGATGSVSVLTGTAASTAGTSGNSGALLLGTGDSADGNSGDVTISTGTAGANRGEINLDAAVLDINCGTVALATQATGITILDNSATSVTISQGANLYLTISTANDAEQIILGTTSPTTPQMSLVLGSPGNYIEAEGINLGTRWVVQENFEQRPQLVASIANTNASKTTEIVGTNGVDAGSVFSATGGIQLTTTGADNDQIIVRPNTAGADDSQSPLMGTQWSTSQSIRFKTSLRVVDTANVRIKVGMMLTAAMDAGTDADQVYFGCSTTDDAFGVGVVNWAAGYSIGGADTDVDTTVAVAAGLIRFVIDVDSARVARFYVNGVLRATSGALTAATNLLPFVGIQTEAVMTRAFVCHGFSVSRAA